MEKVGRVKQGGGADGPGKYFSLLRQSLATFLDGKRLSACQHDFQMDGKAESDLANNALCNGGAGPGRSIHAPECVLDA
ncbi:hypothetical protein [Rhodoblastus sp.]|uniref:hypothetical protein n=1 Tax=Rhodoblastus sp. TaxID=1962975 RepID=UPI003F9B190E